MKLSHALCISAVESKTSAVNPAVWSCSSCIFAHNLNTIVSFVLQIKSTFEQRMLSRQEAWAAQLSSLRGGQPAPKAEGGAPGVSFTGLQIAVGWTPGGCWRGAESVCCFSSTAWYSSSAVPRRTGGYRYFTSLITFPTYATCFSQLCE